MVFGQGNILPRNKVKYSIGDDYSVNKYELVEKAASFCAGSHCHSWIMGGLQGDGSLLSRSLDGDYGVLGFGFWRLDDVREA